ncbi:hypothetical protein OKW11_000730 [Pseudomonas baetica]|nr:hypothetical protein [Pseudomonas baetica]
MMSLSGHDVENGLLGELCCFRPDWVPVSQIGGAAPVLQVD